MTGAEILLMWVFYIFAALICVALGTYATVYLLTLAYERLDDSHCLDHGKAVMSRDKKIFELQKQAHSMGKSLKQTKTKEIDILEKLKAAKKECSLLRTCYCETLDKNEKLTSENAELTAKIDILERKLKDAGIMKTAEAAGDGVKGEEL